MSTHPADETFAGKGGKKAVPTVATEALKPPGLPPLSTMDLLPTSFWALATAKLMASVPVQYMALQRETPYSLRLANGQRKDDWLCAAIMVTTLLLGEYSLSGWAYGRIQQGLTEHAPLLFHLDSALQLSGSAIAAWLIHRSVQRYCALHRE